MLHTDPHLHLLLEGQSGEAWEPSRKQWSFANRDAFDKRVFTLVLAFKGLKLTTLK